MGEITATVMDAVDSRAYECLLPDDEQLSSLAARLADLLHFPVVGPDNCPLDYGFIVKGGDILDTDATLGELELRNGVVLRLVPEVVAGQDATHTPAADSPASPRQRTMLDLIKITEIKPPVDEIESHGRLDVRMDACVHREIEAFARRNPNSECAGLLLGEIGLEGAERVAYITAMASATRAVGSRTSVKMTLDAWASALRVRDRDYAHLRVLGWFHTHAGWGVFLSDSDVFIHRHFFSDPNMVAYVLDPTVGRDGFFCWREGKISLCSSFGLVCTPQDAGLAGYRKKRGRPIRKYFAGVLATICLAAGLYFGVPRLVHLAAAPVRQPVTVVQNEAPTARVATRETDIIFIISGGETLWSLCDQTYEEGWLAPALARYNKISVRGTLTIGQKIKLPSKEVLHKMQR